MCKFNKENNVTHRHHMQANCHLKKLELTVQFIIIDFPQGPIVCSFTNSRWWLECVTCPSIEAEEELIATRSKILFVDKTIYRGRNWRWTNEIAYDFLSWAAPSWYHFPSVSIFGSTKWLSVSFKPQYNKLCIDFFKLVWQLPLLLLESR